MMKPITPDEVVRAKANTIPDEVFQAFNELIAESWNGRYAQFTQDAVLNRICGHLDCPRELPFAKGWLDIEPMYREAGWTVKYDKPGYNEDYSATFKFEKPRG